MAVGVLTAVALISCSGPARGNTGHGSGGLRSTSPVRPVHGVVYLCGACPNGAASRADVRTIDALLHNTDAVTGVRYFDHQQAYERFRELFADQPELSASVGPSDLPASFEFTARSPAVYAAVARALRRQHGVDQVQRQLSLPVRTPGR